MPVGPHLSTPSTLQTFGTRPKFALAQSLSSLPKYATLREARAREGTATGGLVPPSRKCLACYTEEEQGPQARGVKSLIFQQLSNAQLSFRRDPSGLVPLGEYGFKLGTEAR